MNREVDFISSSTSMISLSLAPVKRLKNARSEDSFYFFFLSLFETRIKWVCELYRFSHRPRPRFCSPMSWTRSRHLEEGLKLWNGLIWGLLHWETTPNLCKLSKPSLSLKKRHFGEFANSIDFLIDQGLVSVHQWVKRGVDTLRRAWSFETGWFEAFLIEKQVQAFASFRNQVCLWKKPLVFSAQVWNTHDMSPTQHQGNMLQINGLQHWHQERQTCALGKIADWFWFILVVLQRQPYLVASDF